MTRISSLFACAFLLLFGSAAAQAASVYWNVFNIEGESDQGAGIVTYASLADMLTDQNRTSVNIFSAPSGRNIVDAGSDGLTYWNLFNIEGESDQGAGIVTYASLADMLTDQNRTSVNIFSAPSGRNIVGSGSDGGIYWNVFNIEGESDQAAAIVTYASLLDMLTDQNRSSVNIFSAPSGRNIVGSGSDGLTYWNVFNIEGESDQGAGIVTYASLADMLTDQNRTSVNIFSAPSGRNIVGSGAFTMSAIPEPGSAILLLGGVLALAIGSYRRRA